ncbi:homoprotocatechuate degradation operon regulator, HpaR [Rhizobiales bacterium GAS191]|nr:homoprotocatechuate degradation operon regulator, HpaR [Rhizobiales bacterium GAS113]SEC89587.1 homoprotocatechuate degradation operon regulator, HpaR [Rhizobiales bacterium GAS191]
MTAPKVTDRKVTDPKVTDPKVTDPKPPQIALRDFSRSLPMALMRAREATMRYFRPSLRAHGLSEQQWRVLRALAARGPIEAMALARATFLLPPSLSRILRDLGERKLIERRADQSDLRRSVIGISAAGYELIAAHAPASEAGYAEIARRFGPERLARLQAELDELEKALLDGDDPVAAPSGEAES